jgi:hypothetical protein
VQVEGCDDRHVRARRCSAHDLEQDALGNRPPRCDCPHRGRRIRRRRAAGGLEPLRTYRAHSSKKPCSTAPFGSVIASAMPTGLHAPAVASIAATKPGVSGQHRRRRGAARFGQGIVAFEIGPGEEMRLGRRRRELVALDREGENCRCAARRAGGMARFDRVGSFVGRLMLLFSVARPAQEQKQCHFRGLSEAKEPDPKHTGPGRSRSGRLFRPVAWNCFFMGFPAPQPHLRCAPRMTVGGQNPATELARWSQCE